MKRAVFCFVSCLVLSGCASPPLFKPVTVEVPVAVPCSSPDVSPPSWPFQILPPHASLFEKVRALLAENELRQSYEAQLEAAVESCR